MSRNRQHASRSRRSARPAPDPGDAGRRTPARPADRRAAGRPDGRRTTWLLLLAGTIVAVSLLRLIHLGFPLERDEGEFGYIAQELLRGVPVYLSAYTQKLPGTYAIYALFLALFGQSATGIHLGLLLVNAVTMLLVYLVVGLLYGRPAGWLAAAVFGLAALSPGVLGFAAHATFFVGLFALAGAYLLLRALRSGRAILFAVSGVGFGLAFLMKQPGVFFAPAAAVIVLLEHLSARPRRWRALAVQIGALLAGALAPFVLVLVGYAAIGQLPLFWFWTWRFAGEFTSQVPLAEIASNLGRGMGAATAGFEPLWALAALGGIAAIAESRHSSRGRFVSIYALASLLTVVPGFYFTPHYFVSFLPALAMLVGALAGSVGSLPLFRARGRVATAATGLVIGLALAFGFARHQEYYLGTTPDVMVARTIYPGQPFPEAVLVGNYLRDHTSEADRVALLGSETEILFYARRRSASRFVNTYYLMASHPRNRAMQREMMRDVERARPAYVVFARVGTSWERHADSPTEILDWIPGYLDAHYQLAGYSPLRPGQAEASWGAEAQATGVPAGDVLIVLRRKEAAGAR